MKRIIKVFLLIGTFLLITSMLVLAMNWSHRETKVNRAIYNSKVTPTILVPGSSASKDRFDYLIKQLNTGNNKHGLIKVVVNKKGDVSMHGKYYANDLAPYFVIAFENNRDGYENIKKQAYWLNKAMSILQEHYRFRQFQAIGHSNGGLIWTRYLEKYYQAQSVQLSVLMTIGTPYNFSEVNVNNRTKMLDDFIKNRKHLPSDLTVYSVLGTETYDNDGIVPEQSVEAGKFIFQKQVAHYTQITVTGDDAQHSDLVQNRQIINLIEQNVLPQNHRDWRKR